MTILKKIYNIFSNIFFGLIIFILIGVVALRYFGYNPYIVLSGSMEPTYKTGSVVFVKEKGPEEIKKNDVISFVSNENLTVVTHRVIEIDKENKCFYTKGDANELADEAPVFFENLIGVATFSIPYVGFVVSIIKETILKYVLIGIVGLTILFDIIFSIREKKNKRKM